MRGRPEDGDQPSPRSLWQGRGVPLCLARAAGSRLPGEAMKFIGVDIGGTFTDVVYADTESSDIRIHKVPTTPDDPSVGMLSAVRDLCEREAIAAAEVDHLFHGTTIATNAVLTHEGALTGMVTSEGYRDILHIGATSGPSTTPSGRRSRGRTGRSCAGGTASPCPSASPRPPARPLSPSTRRRCDGPRGASATTASRRSRCASCSPGSTRPTRSGRRPSCARSTPAASSPRPAPSRPSSVSSSGSRPPR